MLRIDEIVREQLVCAGQTPQRLEVMLIANRVRAFINAEVRAYLSAKKYHGEQMTTDDINRAIMGG